MTFLSKRKWRLRPSILTLFIVLTVPLTVATLGSFVNSTPMNRQNFAPGLVDSAGAADLDDSFA